MKLITELNEDVGIISEATENGSKKLYIEGIFLQSAIKNRNGRIYPEGIMDNEVGRYIKESVETNSALGEIEHPNSPKINADRVSHRIVSLTKEGTNYVGKALIGGPKGDTVKGLIELGARIGVSSRGMGTLKMNRQGINEVQEDFRLATAADIVLDPSGPNCFVQGIMESVDWIYDDKSGNWQAKEVIIEAAKKQINEAVRQRSLQNRAFKIFEEYCSRLAKI